MVKWDGEVNEVVFGWVFASSLADVRDLRRRNFFFRLPFVSVLSHKTYQILLQNETHTIPSWHG